jgi:hypothetical protein
MQRNLLKNMNVKWGPARGGFKQQKGVRIQTREGSREMNMIKVLYIHV